MTEACQTTSQKRKLQPDDHDDNGDDEVKGESSASNLAFSPRAFQLTQLDAYLEEFLWSFVIYRGPWGKLHYPLIR